MTTENISQHGGFIIDVPVTLSVAVRGPDMTEEWASSAARKCAENFCGTVEPGVIIDGATITEYSLESPTDEETSVLDVLEPELLDPDYHLFMCLYTDQNGDSQDQCFVAKNAAEAITEYRRYYAEQELGLPEESVPAKVFMFEGAKVEGPTRLLIWGEHIPTAWSNPFSPDK